MVTHVTRLRRTGLMIGASGWIVLAALIFSSPRHWSESILGSSSPTDVPDAATGNVTLILVDVQRDFWTTEFSAEFPDFEQNVSELLQLCREHDVQIVHVRTEFDAELGNWAAEFLSVHHSSKLCAAGTDGALPLNCAVALEGEPVVIKGNLDGFSGGGLDAQLQRSGAGHVLIAGLYTDVCVLSTALSAFNRGYRVTLVDDCCAARREEHEFVTRRYDGFFLNCVSHETLRRLMEDS